MRAMLLQAFYWMPQNVASSGFNSPKEKSTQLVQVQVEVQVALQLGFSDLVDPVATQVTV